MGIIYQNTFTAADDTPATSVTPEIGSAMVSGVGVYGMVVTSNRLRNNALDSYSVNFTPSLGSDADYTVRASGRFVAGTVGELAFLLYARYDAVADTGYRLRYEGGGVQLIKRLAGTPTTLTYGSWTPTVGVDYDLELVVVGSSIGAFVDGTPLFSPVTDADVASTGAAGLECVYYGSSDATEGWHWNALEIETVGASSVASSAAAAVLRPGRLLAL